MCNFNNNCNSGCNSGCGVANAVRCNSGCSSNVCGCNSGCGSARSGCNSGCGSTRSGCNSGCASNGSGCNSGCGVANAIRNNLGCNQCRRCNRCRCCCCCRRYANDRQLFANYTLLDQVVIPTGVFNYVELNNESQGTIALVNENYGIELARGVYEITYGFNVMGSFNFKMNVNMELDGNVVPESKISQVLVPGHYTAVSKTFLVNVVSETSLAEILNESSFDITMSDFSMVIKKIGYAEVL